MKIKMNDFQRMAYESGHAAEESISKLGGAATIQDCPNYLLRENLELKASSPDAWEKIKEMKLASWWWAGVTGHRLEQEKIKAQNWWKK